MATKHSIAIPAGTPTQVAHQARTMFRTLVQGAVGALVALLASKGLDLTQYTEALVAVVWTVVTAGVTWLMTRPGVNSFIDRWLPFLSTGVEQETGKAQPAGDAPLSAPAGEDDEPVVVLDFEQEA